MQLKVGEQRYLVCGILKRVAPYEMEGETGFSGQVDFMGGWTKFTCDAMACAALKPFVGKPVQLTGIPKVAGDRGQRGELKLGVVLQAHHEGQQIYSSESANDPASAAEAPARRGVFGGK